jgi:hypothetical protein
MELEQSNGTGEAQEQFVFTFEKNAEESLRGRIYEFKGHKLVDFRLYYRDANDELKPTKKGFSLNVNLWNDFKSGIDAMEEALKSQGVLEEELAAVP